MIRTIGVADRETLEQNLKRLKLRHVLIPVKPTIKSDRNQPPSPVETFHVFRFKLTTDSGEIDHSIRAKRCWLFRLAYL